ncbi:MAG TPA: response regulator, partial [bacterium]|nr:response regulator [bacterium]
MSRTILLIDPNLALAAKIAKFLEDFGHTVEFTSSKNEGLGAIKTFDPCLVVASFALPDGDALDLIKTMRDALHKLTPVLVMATSKQIEHYSDRPMPNGPQGWLKQPVDQMDLYNMINSWIGRQVDPSTPVAAPPPPREEPMRLKTAMPPHEDEEEESKTPATSQIGNLARVPVARLFYHLGRRQLTGQMILHNTPTKIEVHFEKGVVVNVVSNYIPELSLGVLLAKKMVLTPQELVGARKRWEREGGMFGQI